MKLGLWFFLLLPLELQAAGLAWQLPPQPLATGVPFVATLSLTRPSGSNLLPPPLPLQVDGLRILQRSALPMQLLPEAEVLAVEYSLLALQAGTFTLPALHSPLGQTKAVKILIQGPAPAEPALPAAGWSPWGLLPLLAIPLLWLWKPRPALPVPTPRPRPQDEIAQALAACRRLAEQGHGPELYQALSPLLRRLLEEGYGLNAKGKTTEELVRGGMPGLGPWEQDDLQKFLRYSDPVNYAQAEAQPEPALAVIQALEHLNRHAPHWEAEAP